MATKKMTFMASSAKIDPDLKYMQDSGFTKNEIEELREQLKKMEAAKAGVSINKYELFDILKCKIYEEN